MNVVRHLPLFSVLLWTASASAGPLDSLGAAKPYVARVIDLLALPSGDCDQTCQLRSLVTDASITYGKLNDQDHAAVFLTVHTKRGDREVVLLMQVVTEDVVKSVPQQEPINGSSESANSDKKTLRVAAIGPQIDGGKPTHVVFSDEGVIYTSLSGPSHKLELNERGILVSKVVAPPYLGSKNFIIERESVYPANTADAVTLGMPFSIDAVRSVLPARLKLNLETLEGIDTISTSLGRAKDAGSVEIYAKDGKVDGIEVGNNAENSIGVKIGAPAASIPGVRPKDCEIDDLSGDYVCHVKPEPYFYRLGMKGCARPPNDAQLPAKPKSITCMNVIGISIGNTRM